MNMRVYFYCRLLFFLGCSSRERLYQTNAFVSPPRQTSTIPSLLSPYSSSSLITPSFLFAETNDEDISSRGKNVSVSHYDSSNGRQWNQKQQWRRGQQQQQRNPNKNNSVRHRRGYYGGSSDIRKKDISKNNASQRRQWLEQATTNLLSTKPGSLEKGKWHELKSMLYAWSSFVKDDPEAPSKMEIILKRLNDERRAGNMAARANISMYNKLLDGWACAGLFKTLPTYRGPQIASQRAREILVLLQETYEQQGDPDLRPNEESFRLVLHVVCRVEKPIFARRILAWMEYLHKSGKNPSAQPSRYHYIQILDSYANSKKSNAGVMAEGFLRHMNATGIVTDTYCYNLAIKAWLKSRRGREAAEHADQIMQEMHAPKDIVTYASAISAWASSGMRAHAVSRVEELLRDIEAHPVLEPNTIVLNAVMSAWVKSRNPAAHNRTGELLREMELSEYIQPDLISYNTHLHALSLQSRKVSANAKLASDLVKRMEKRYDSGEVSFKPNLFSYNLVIDAWAKSSHPRAAEKASVALGRLAKRDGIDPDTFSFNQVLSALSRSFMKGAAKRAEELLEYMETAHASGIHPRAKPDVISYSSVIVAHSRSGEPGAALRAEHIFNQMKQRYLDGARHLKPNRICYNSLITAWAKSGEGTYGARKAEALLMEMQLGGEHDENMAPNIVSYNAVLNAWARSGTRCCGIKAESYLNRMWQLYEAGDNQVKPNDHSYNTVINAISKSQNEFKAQKALRILRRMDLLYQAGNKEARPNEVTYTAVLNSCAFPAAAADEKTLRRALDTAIFTLEELQASRYGQPNQVTYGTFIKACANLIDGDKNDKLLRQVIERVFQQCCEDGQVGEMVLAHLRHAAPADLYEELLAEALGSPTASASSSPTLSMVSVEDLPVEWRCNVGNHRRPPTTSSGGRWGVHSSVRDNSPRTTTSRTGTRWATTTRSSLKNSNDETKGVGP